MPTKTDFEFEQLEYVVGSSDSVAGLVSARALPPFSDSVIAFLNALSRRLISVGREYSDVATFAFWCRKAALMHEREQYEGVMGFGARLGRGTVFHSTPSNVPVNFAFSLAAGLLSGNKNIIRLPAKPFAQVDIISHAINELLLNEYHDMSDYVVMVKFPPIKRITDAFSSICDVRVIWGGDATIAEIRQSPLAPRATEVTFADRHSICVIDAKAYIEAAKTDAEAIARDFYNDTFFSDQNACTAPRLVAWLGDDAEEAKRIFWNELHKLVKQKYQLKPVQSVGKLTAAERAAIGCPGVKMSMVSSEDMLITRIKTDILAPELMRFKYNSGFFFEYDAASLDELAPVCTLPCQTLLHYGIDKTQITEFVLNNAPRGVDRAVPIGKSMDFSLRWDGYDLILQLSRLITVR